MIARRFVRYSRAVFEQRHDDLLSEWGRAMRPGDERHTCGSAEGGWRSPQRWNETLPSIELHDSDLLERIDAIVRRCGAIGCRMLSAHYVDNLGFSGLRRELVRLGVQMHVVDALRAAKHRFAYLYDGTAIGRLERATRHAAQSGEADMA